MSKATYKKGEEHWCAKLVEEDVRDIRAQAAAKVPLADIAKEYGLHLESVRKIVKRTRWREVV